MLKKILPRPNRETWIIIYKLLNDFLVVGLLFFMFFLISEGLIPGIISSHIGFFFPTLFVCFAISGIYFIARHLEIEIKKDDSSKKTAYVLLFLLTLLVINSVLTVGIFMSLILAILTGISGFLAYLVISEK